MVVKCNLSQPHLVIQGLLTGRSRGFVGSIV